MSEDKQYEFDKEPLKACERCGRFEWEECNGFGLEYNPCPKAKTKKRLSPPRTSNVITKVGTDKVSSREGA